MSPAANVGGVGIMQLAATGAPAGPTRIGPATTQAPSIAVPIPAATTSSWRGSSAVADARRGSSELTFAQMNAWNLFDTIDDPLTRDTVLTQEQYEIKLAKLARVIRDELGGPDVIGLQEIENDRVLIDLAARPEIAALGYRFVVAPLNDGRGIRTGMLYRGDVLEAVGATSPNPVPRTPLKDGGAGQLNGALLYARAPLVVDFRVRGAAQSIEGQQLTVAVAHFKSKLGGERFQPRRDLQGAYLGGVVDAARRANPDAPVVVIGDLNAGFGEGAYERLVTAPDGTRRLHDASKLIPEDERYSYVYRGKRDMLDHILVTPDIRDAMVDTKITRINTRPGDAKHQWDPDTVIGSSDHEFVLTRIDLARRAAEQVAR
jgi:predicted extracellular nuclease